MDTLKKVTLSILVLVVVMTFFTITVKATTNIKQSNYTDEQALQTDKSDLKETEKTSNLDTMEETKPQDKDSDNIKEVITESMDPNNKVDVTQYSQEQNEQVSEEQQWHD